MFTYICTYIQQDVLTSTTWIFHSRNAEHLMNSQQVLPTRQIFQVVYNKHLHLFTYICMYVWSYVHMQVYANIDVVAFAADLQHFYQNTTNKQKQRAHIHAHIYKYLSVCVCLCVRANMSVNIYKYECLYMYILSTACCCLPNCFIFHTYTCSEIVWKIATTKKDKIFEIVHASVERSVATQRQTERENHVKKAREV